MSTVLSNLDIQLAQSNFDFMKLDFGLMNLHQLATKAEFDFATEHYDDTLFNIRKVAEHVCELIIDNHFDTVPTQASFDNKISQIKTKYNVLPQVIDALYDVKNNGNKGVHTIVNDRKLAYESMTKMRAILRWYMHTYVKEDVKQEQFVVPTIVTRFKNNQERKIIYIQTADNSSGNWPLYDGAEKIGETTAPYDDMEADWSVNSAFLRDVSRKRVNSYMKTSGVPYTIEWSELAWIKSTKKWFGDAAVHDVLMRSGFNRKAGLDGNEWFDVDLETAKAAIAAVKAGRQSLQIESENKPMKIVLREEQQAAVNQAKTAFKKHQKVLWNAKMRFGKTLSTYELIKQKKYKKVLVMTHRPVVSDSWFDDFKKLEMAQAGYEFGSKTQGEGDLKKLLAKNVPFIYFASIQDLRGASIVGGAFAKNDEFFATDWDLIVVDEAHEGTQTQRGDKLYEELTDKKTRILELSGTPFNILEDFSEEQVFTWDYIMEQQAKIRFATQYPELANPYESLPEMEMYTFAMESAKKFQNADKYFDFAEFFKVDGGKFVHERAVKQWLNQISADGKTHYPFATPKYRESLRHTLWLLPSRASAGALKTLLEQHQVFKDYTVLNVVNDNDNEVSANDPDMERVRAAITDQPHETKTIILTVRKLTTGVNIPELNAVVFLNNTTSAQNYLQAAFRAQTPFSHEVLGMKKKAYIFDFAPDRALNILAKSVSMSPKAGALNDTEQKQKLGQLLNFLPVLEQADNQMQPYSMETMMRQLKKAYAEKAVLSGFDDVSIYNDELWKATSEDAELFNELNNKLGTTKQTKGTKQVVISENGLDEGTRQTAIEGKKKPVKERSEDEKAAIEFEAKMRSERNNMIAILRGISIRIPLMIYGMDLDVEKDITLDDFVKLVDDVSWHEFMPKGISKKDFMRFKKFYDPEIFVEAGHRIRQAAQSANNLSYQDRIEKITTIFAGFKNPDKETVLTPWRVVNLQLGETLGGYNFFDTDYKAPLDNGGYREIDQGDITYQAFNKSAKILEINSKTGLYPLYMAFSIYQCRFEQESQTWSKAEWTQQDKALWQSVLENNIYVINKTPMARTITYRTLNGYEQNEQVKNNLIYIEDLTSKLKSNLEATKQEILTQFGDETMKFDVVVGNPPYQESREDTRDDAVYHYFYDLAEQISSKYALISPARFLFNAGSTDKKWNQKMLSDEHVKVMYYEQSSAKIFPNTDIKGGVAILFRDEQQKFGEIGTFTIYPELTSIVHKVEAGMTETLDTVITGQGIYRFTQKMHDNHPEVSAILPASHQFDISTGVFGTLNDIVFFENKPEDTHEYTLMLGRYQNERVHRWIRTDYVNEPTGFDKWRLILPNANGTGALGETLSTPLVGEPLIGFTQTFLSIGQYDLKADAENTMKYIKTKFARTMLGVLKVTQHNPSAKWKFVPLQDFTASSDIDWSKSVQEIDQQLYAKYGLSTTEIAFIEEKVKPME